MTLRDEIHRILEHGDATTADYVDAILSLLLQLFEFRKVRKWDEIKWHTSCPHEDADCAISPELENVKDDLQTIMEGLEVEERFKEYEGFYNDKSFIRRTRPATPEEVREVIEVILNRLFADGLFSEDGWTLKSGAILRLKK